MAAAVHSIRPPPGLGLMYPAQHVHLSLVNANDNIQGQHASSQMHGFWDESKRRLRTLESQPAKIEGRFSVHMSKAEPGEPVYLYFGEGYGKRHRDSLGSDTSMTSTAASPTGVDSTDEVCAPHDDASSSSIDDTTCAVSTEHSSSSLQTPYKSSKYVCKPRGSQTTVLIAYFPRCATEANLRSALTNVTSSHSIEYLTIMREPNGASKCFGFAKFDTTEHAQMVINACSDGKVVADDETGKRWHLKASLAKKEAIFKNESADTRERRPTEKHGKRSWR